MAASSFTNMEKKRLDIRMTPVELLQALYRKPGTILLETQRPSFSDRYSIVAWEPEKVFQGDIDTLSRDAFFSFLSDHKDQYLVAGYIGYEACRWMEDLPEPGKKDRPTPDIYLAAYPAYLIFDHIQDTWFSVCGRHSPAPPGICRTSCRYEPGRIDGFNQDKQAYINNVYRILDYIRAGDVYEVNYTQRLYFRYGGDCLELYRRLKRIQPVAFAAYINLGNGVVISGSPELFLRVKAGNILTKPMKGTRKRSSRPSEDRQLRHALSRSEKDRAENTMIVDLMRNDLGRVCDHGSVNVPRPYVVEAYDTVFQMVSYVSGRLRKDVQSGDVIAATFPPGSITGAPKKRVMEIIYELEPNARGVYCGGIGYFQGDEMALNVAIRTLELFDGRGVLGIGGGIVADSDPESEYEESLLKARAAVLAIGLEDQPGGLAGDQ